MRILIIDSYATDDPGAEAVNAALDILRAGGHEVDYVSLHDPEFDVFMSAEERIAYETETPLIADATRQSAELLLACDALLFCYPTTLFGVPPRLKSWLERVMVVGVAFTFSKRQRLKGDLRNVRRLGIITSTSHSRREMIKARDLGRRLIMRALRVNCHPMCRTTFVRLQDGAPAGRARDQLNRHLATW